MKTKVFLFVKGFLFDLKGQGTDEAPWEIHTIGDLLRLQSLVNSGNDFKDQVVALMTDSISVYDENWNEDEEKMEWVGLGTPEAASASTHSPYITGGTGFAGTFICTDWPMHLDK